MKASEDNSDRANQKHSNDPEDEMTEPDELAAAITMHLRNALDAIEVFTEELAASIQAVE